MGKSKKDAGAGAASQARAKDELAERYLTGVKDPDYEYIKQQIENASKQVPELAGLLEAQQLERYKDIEFDPRLREAEMAALEQMQERAIGGLSEEDKLAYGDIRESMAADAASQQADIGRRMAEQGAGGSGQELAQRIAGQQQAALQASKAGRGMAADALQAKMQAGQMAGQMAGKMGGTDINRQQLNRQGAFYINQANMKQRANVNQANLNAQQQLNNQRSMLMQQKYGQLGQLEHQKYANAMGRASQLANLYGSQADRYRAQAASDRARGNKPGMLSKGLGLVGTGVGAYFGSVAGPMGTAAGASIGGALGSGIGGMAEGYEDGGVVANDSGYKSDKEKNADILNTIAKSMSSSGAKQPQAADPLAQYKTPTISGEVNPDSVFSNFRPVSQGPSFRYQDGGVVDNAEIASISDQLIAMREKDPSLIGSKEYQDLLRAKSRMQHDEYLKIPASKPDLGPMQDVLPRTINPNDTREDFRRRAIEEAMNPMTYSEMSRINDVNSQVDARDNNVHYPEEEGTEFSYADRESEENALRTQEKKDRNYNVTEGYANGGVVDWGSVANRLGDNNPFMQKASAQDQIAQFNAMNTKKYAQGGVPGIIAENGDVVSVDGGFIFPGEEDEYANDRVDAKVNRGEMILNAEQQQRMLDVLRGEQSPEILKNGEDVVETPEAAQNRGFLKVLEMIGKK